jgi:hypothetical protein
MCKSRQLVAGAHLLSCCSWLLLPPEAAALGSSQVSCPGWWRRDHAAVWLCLLIEGISQHQSGLLYV